MAENAVHEKIDRIAEYTNLCKKNFDINPELYSKYDVKRGLRDVNGKGVLTGLTKIAEVKSYTIDDGDIIPCEGKLYYHGINMEQIVNGFTADNRFGFEEVAYLLLFGELPSKQQLEQFNQDLVYYRDLPTSFTRDVILRAPSRNIMNSLARSVLTLYTYDDKADSTDTEVVMRQSLQMIARFPRLAVYSYQGLKHYYDEQSLFIHAPSPELSTAQNILYMLRPDHSFTPLEAQVLDIALVVQADHGGGNNSTFTTRVVTSSGTDTYSTIASALGSLKGPRHGGANVKVAEMFEDMKTKVKNWTSDTEVTQYISDILDKKTFDNAGLIYGMGHAVYSVSDPRAEIFKKYVKVLAQEKGKEDELELYTRVERLAPDVINSKRKTYKPISANIDFYSGFVYSMLGLPNELFTPIFAISRVAGWCAHRLEELLNNSKIIRPAYKNVTKHCEYVDINNRK
ncbi:MAG: citrate/2-methylcitrate synthase [Oscillospiraceae bacterium]|nr:citrate/2-methylcitrate synthase [Oscillospiraceae bacterium]